MEIQPEEIVERATLRRTLLEIIIQRILEEVALLITVRLQTLHLVIQPQVGRITVQVIYQDQVVADLQVHFPEVLAAVHLQEVEDANNIYV